MITFSIVILNLTVLAPWIGLTDKEVVDMFVWESTGELLTWSNWQPGQPWSPAGLDADCVAVKIYSWYDEECTQLRYPICEQPE